MCSNETKVSHFYLDASTIRGRVEGALDRRPRNNQLFSKISCAAVTRHPPQRQSDTDSECGPRHSIMWRCRTQAFSSFWNVGSDTSDIFET